MSKQIAILLEDYFDEREVIYPYYRVMEAGYTPVLVAPKIGEYHGKSTFSLKAAVSGSEVTSDEFAGLIVPGGFAPDRLRRFRAITDLVHDINREGKPLGAICHAGWVLVSANVVKDRTVTGFMSIRADLENAGAHYIADQNVVVDGNLVTAQHADDSAAFMKAFVDLLK